MAAHLDLIHLRRHALPAHFMTVTDRLAEAPGQVGTARPRLTMTWLLNASGRPVYAWSLDTADHGVLPT